MGTFNVINPGQWAGNWKEENYSWFSSTNFFCPKLYDLNEYQESCNNQIARNCNRMEGFWDIIKSQLDNEPSFNNHEEVCILNTELVTGSDVQLEMNERFREYFNSYDEPYYYSSDNQKCVAVRAIKNKKIIVPFVYQDHRSIKFLNKVVPQFFQICSAKSVVVVYACNIVPDKNGNYPNIDDYPDIDQCSFGIKLSHEQVMNVLNLAVGSQSSEKFQRLAKPVSLEGTVWKSTDGAHLLRFDANSLNVAKHNGDIAYYSFDTTNRKLSLKIIDIGLLCQSIDLDVISYSSDQMIVEGRVWGRVTLNKVNE